MLKVDKMNYDAINFKNKDIDRFSTKFNQKQGDPKKKDSQSNSATADSSDYYNKLTKVNYDIANTIENAPYGGRLVKEQREGRKKQADLFYKAAEQSTKDSMRQIRKGKPGYDKDGHPNKPMTGMEYLQKLYPNK